MSSWTRTKPGSAEAPIEMRACSGHQDARISIGLRALSSVSQTNFPHLDFSLPQSAAGNLLIFAACNRKISRKFKCTNCHPENCSTAVTQQRKRGITVYAKPATFRQIGTHGDYYRIQSIKFCTSRLPSSASGSAVVFYVTGEKQQIY